MVADLAGRAIEIARHDYSLQLWTDDNWEIDLAGRTFLSIPGSDPIEIDTTLCQDDLVDEVRPLVGAMISAMTVTGDGDLLISIGNMRLQVVVGDDHEAWEISGPKGEKVVCMPGGELAVWGPRID